MDFMAASRRVLLPGKLPYEGLFEELLKFMLVVWGEGVWVCSPLSLKIGINNILKTYSSARNCLYIT